MSFGILACWDTEKDSAKAIAARLDQKYSTDEEKSWEAGTPKEWADESLALTIKYVYPLPDFVCWRQKNR